MIEHNADPFDAASELEDMERESIIRSVRARKPLVRTGHCLFCNDVTEGGRLFCSEDCAHDHEFEERVKHFTGVR